MLFILFLVCLANVAFAAQSSVNFLLLGDWGGQGSSPYYTAAQVAVAKGMATIASSINAEFIVAMGDNFYSNGVTSDKDTRFTNTWLNIYTAASLQKPWYVIAGNHDHNGNVTGQIAYSNDNALWNFPSEYYLLNFKSNDNTVSVDIIMIDTVDLSGASSYAETDPRFFDPLPEIPASELPNNPQWNFINDALVASKANYTLVVGHYPVYSVCEHGPTATLVTNLKPLLEQYQAHMFNGHDVSYLVL